MQGWIDLFRSLGESLITVVRAEVGALQEDLKTSGRHMGVALALFGAAALLSFWVIGLLIFLLIAGIHVWLPLWASAGIVFLVFAGVMAVLAWLGLRRWRLAENPVDSVKRHVDDHLDWWQNGLLAKDRTTMDIPAAAVLSSEDIREDLP
jgi:hypothetical protein